MQTEWIECIPNISEGRSQPIQTDLYPSLQKIENLHVLHLHCDGDHHRSVLTLAGNRSGIQNAMLSLCQWAIQSIDLRHHQGVHPRMGAVDVIPLVSLAGISEEACIAFSRELAESIATTFQLPVYLYERSALQPNRQNLADIRRGGFEKLAEKMRQSNWKPDYGSSVPHPTFGAVAVGVRAPLIAFNVLLDTPKRSLVQHIAQIIRESSGGMKGLKAMGVYLKSKDRAQVSMNIVDHQTVSLYEVMERIQKEAHKQGVKVLGSELVGLVPKSAIEKGNVADLHILNWHEQLILENALEQITKKHLKIPLKLW